MMGHVGEDKWHPRPSRFGREARGLDQAGIPQEPLATAIDLAPAAAGSGDRPCRGRLAEPPRQILDEHTIGRRSSCARSMLRQGSDRLNEREGWVSFSRGVLLLKASILLVVVSLGVTLLLRQSQARRMGWTAIASLVALGLIAVQILRGLDTRWR